jgi:hypothetical protein
MMSLCIHDDPFFDESESKIESQIDHSMRLGGGVWLEDAIAIEVSGTDTKQRYGLLLCHGLGCCEHEIAIRIPVFEVCSTEKQNHVRNILW